MDIASSNAQFAHFMWSERLNKALNFDELAKSGEYPMLADLLTLTVGSTILITLFRWIFEAVLSLRAFGLADNVKAKERPLPVQSAELEKIYSERRLNLPDINEVKSISVKTKISVEQVNKWFQLRQRIDRNDIKVKRFKEGVWRLFMYTICFFTGYTLIKNEPWYHDTSLCWTTIFTEPIPEDLKLFYIGLQLPLYLHLSLQLLFDSRKSPDNWEMLSHHLVAVLLIGLSYIGNFTRMGALCLLYHDVTDLFLESTKILNYLRWTSLSNLAFFGLVSCWGYARLYKFATVIIYSVMYEAVEADVFGSSYPYFLGGLLVIFCLNVYWFHAISQMAYRVLWGGTEKVRERAMTDLSTDDEYDSDDSSFRSDSEFSQDSEAKKLK
mmetsp:Transcript_21780/g.26458  ORF Transcript_21780/g.26458 Transcript_21780/m.26458 type:complete len:383 (+) Transcript_21780:309-1457(+)|eukprot:CAMPEP_0204836000 /NCGR_PEP_ID=MMETSP1346-20131115/24190_1 /ASSEMBLY_ACC=CAM_ASM_000771 /TAXON_ID=215587 /ORGANISM="Aplanochytrium stocchinoi, Strain GSBS06" /LENGTH=382 /DNA_ID=CAMNT_0051970457 /DNA_START=214 /DNA_END=1362 /DNA_ORIENTATION=+